MLLPYTYTADQTLLEILSQEAATEAPAAREFGLVTLAVTLLFFASILVLDVITHANEVKVFWQRLQELWRSNDNIRGQAFTSAWSSKERI